jgi:hypothetical protein
VFGGVRPVAVIVREFLTGTDVPHGDNPDGAGRLLYRAIGVTGMVDEAGCVSKGFAVYISVGIQLKDVDIALAQASGALLFGNLLARVLDDSSAAFDCQGGKESPSCNP